MIGSYIFVLFKFVFLNDKEDFYSHLIDGNVFLVVRKQLLCVGAKTDVCGRLRNYFPQYLAYIISDNREYPWRLSTFTVPNLKVFYCAGWDGL